MRVNGECHTAERQNPFLRAADTGPASGTVSSRCIGEAEFAAVYAAADFAAEFGLFLDTSVTISWSMLSVAGDAAVQSAFSSFTKCLGDWLRQRTIPVAYTFSHEHGPKVGLHTHLSLFVPGGCWRQEFRGWVQEWVSRYTGRAVPHAVRVTGPADESEWMHWLKFAYAMKGYDQRCVVQSSRSAPDGNTVYLGDLIPFSWCDPGPVILKHRVGASRSLGPDRRAIGAPYDYMLEPRSGGCRFSFDASRHTGPIEAVMPSSAKPFRSRYEDGVRDVRVLYGADLFERVTQMSARDTVAQIEDDLGWLDLLKI